MMSADAVTFKSEGRGRVYDSIVETIRVWTR